MPALRDLLKSLWRRRALLLELTRREFSGRYQGSFGGIIWSFVQPLFLLAVYTVAFGVILNTRFAQVGSTTDYALTIFAGLIIFNAFSECLNKSTTLITANPNFVKKVVFPLELMSVVSVTAVLIHAMIAMVVWFIGYIFLYGMPHTTAILFPIVLLCLIPVLLGLSWLFSAVGVVVRDIGHLTGVLVHATLFLTPVFYSIDAVPPLLRTVLLLNPLTFIVEQFRAVLFIGRLPNFEGLAVYFLLACVFAWISLVIFKRLRPSFADMV